MKENIYVAKNCYNCKHVLRLFEYFNPSINAVMNRLNDTPVPCYCNIDKTCPVKDEKEFNEKAKCSYNIKHKLCKWIDLQDKEEPESSTKFVGYGNMCCDNWESNK